MIPELVSVVSGVPDVLPPGVHDCTIAELHATFGWSPRREWLLEGLRLAMADLHAAGCPRIYLGGSFVSSLDHPDDFDGCWDPVGVNPNALHRMYQAMPEMKNDQKAHHRGELWIGNHQLPGVDSWPRFFQRDTRRGISCKGILVIPNV